MPEICTFYGLLIFMNYHEHNPPHLHVRYQDQEIIVEIQTGIVQGKMSKRALKMIFEWYEQHIDELQMNWDLAEERKPLKRIEPLH
jgi:hypothetical protein